MIRRALLVAATVMAGFALPGGGVHAADIKVLTSVALTSVLDELVPAFEKATGDKVTVGYGLAAELKKRILAGETADVIMLTRAMMDDLQKENKVAAAGLVNVAGTPVAVAARAGAPKPDIGTVDAFKRTLLAARSIVYADPAKGGVSGVYFASVLNRLGIADQLKDKTILVPGAQAPEVAWSSTIAPRTHIASFAISSARQGRRSASSPSNTTFAKTSPKAPMFSYSTRLRSR